LKFISSNLAGGTTVGSTTYKTGNAVAADIGYYHTGLKADGDGFSWGVVLSNLGSKIAYTDNADAKDFIPANLGIGFNYNNRINTTNNISFGVELNKLLVPTPPKLSNGADPAGDSAALIKYRDRSVASSWLRSFGEGDGINEEIQEITMSAGAEYWYNNQFGFRAGYFYENANKGNRKYFTVGASVKYSLATLNFSYLFPTGNGINRNPLSNTYRFGLVFDFPGGN